MIPQIPQNGPPEGRYGPKTPKLGKIGKFCHPPKSSKSPILGSYICEDNEGSCRASTKIISSCTFTRAQCALYYSDSSPFVKVRRGGFQERDRGEERVQNKSASTLGRHSPRTLSPPSSPKRLGENIYKQRKRHHRTSNKTFLRDIQGHASMQELSLSRIKTCRRVQWQSVGSDLFFSMVVVTEHSLDPRSKGIS